MADFVNKHPLGVAFIMCLLLFLTAGTFFNAVISDYEVSYFIIAIFLGCFEKDFIRRAVFLVTALCLFALNLFFGGGHGFLFVIEMMLLFGIIWQNKNENRIFEFGIVAAAFLLHLYYIQNTAVDVRQHDLSGILSYMRRITENGINWRGFNPWDMYYYFHQPAHFIINGYILLFELRLWSSGLLAHEGLQYVSLFYVTAATIFAAGIFKALAFRPVVFYTLLGLFAFNPTLSLFAGYISDDTPVIFLGCLVIYFFIKWYKEGLYRYIFAAALSFGFGVLTKLSILMLVFGLLFLFLSKFCLTKENRESVVKSFCIFIITAVPLSLVWIIRNHVLFDMQFYNIPDTSPLGQNFRYLSLFERLSDFSMLSMPFINVPSVVDGNMWLSLIKTELFGEWDFSFGRSYIYMAAFLLYGLNIILKLFAFLGCGIILFKSSRQFCLQSALNLFFVILYLTIWGYSFKYAMDYPYACSSDYRLFALLILPECVILGSAYKGQTANKLLFAAAIIYGILSCFIYTAGL